MTDLSFTLGNAPPAGRADELVADTTTQRFAADVLEESRRRPVLVDFWAPWCGPCRTLSPIIEKAVRDARGAVKLIKMNIDDHPAIPGQLGIQSIPAVIAFVEGRPIDGFMGAIPEGKIKAFIDKVIADAGGPKAAAADEVLAEAEQLMAAGDPRQAAQLYAALREADPASVPAIAGLVRAAVALGDLDGARQMLALTPPGKTNDPAIAAAAAELALAEQTAGLGDPDMLAARIAADPGDHQARFDLALIENARGNRTRAADLLLDIIRRDRSWQEDKARTQLVQFFQVWGPREPETLAGRRRLSSLLFS